jgi:hypothetical protein
MKSIFRLPLSARALFSSLMVLTAGSTLTAQSIIMAPSSEPALAPVLRREVPPPPASNLPAGGLSPYHLGPVELHPRLSYQFTSGDGLPVRGGQRISSNIQTFTAGVTADLGDHWSMDYSPTWVSYSSETMNDSFDQSASLSGAYQIDDWGFSISQSYTKGSPTLAELAQQTDQTSWNTAFGTNYVFSEKTRFQASLSVNDRQTSQANNLRTWSGGASVNYRFTPRLSLNVGPGFTYTQIANGADISGENYSAQINWEITDKINVGFSTGIGRTKLDATNGRNFSSPSLDFTVGYRPIEATSVSASYTKKVSPSYFKDQATEDVGWSLGFNQRLLGRFYFGANYSHRTSDYASLKSLVIVNRSDVIKSLGLSLSTRLSDRISASASWSKSENVTNATAFAYSSKQYSLSLSYRY